MTTREVLVEARRILTPDGAWTQGVLARDATGAEVGYDDDTATCWCVDGAVTLAADEGDGRNDPSWSAAWEALKEVAPGDWNVALIDWNDAPGRTQAEVLALLDRAIENEEGKA